MLGVGRRVVVRRPESNPAFTSPDDAVVVHSFRESLELGLDLAVVCNPTSLHVATARQYAAAGIPVLVEKPLAPRLAEAERLAQEADASGASAGMTYCMRYHPAYALARKSICQGKLGTIERASAWFESYLPDWHPWEDYRRSYAALAELGGGVLPTLDHEIDFVHWCFGPPVSSSGISTRSGTLEIDVDDAAQITMNYPGHAVEIRLSLCQPERRRGFEFVGRQAALRFSFDGQRLELYKAGSVAEVLWHEPAFDLNTIYSAMLREALEAIATGLAPPISLAAGVDALRVIEAVRSSGFPA